MENLKALVAAAIEEGRLHRIPDGARSLPMPSEGKEPKVRPETCGCGRHYPTVPMLDDRDE